MKTKAFIAILLLFSTIACKKETTFTNNPNADDLHDKAVGFSANHLLSAGTYKSLKIEFQYMTGFAPDAAALNHLQSVLSAYLNKPSGITIVTKEIPASSSTTLSIDQVRKVEEENRTVFTVGDQLGVYFLYTNGNFTDNNVLGAAYRNTSMVLFGKKIHDNSGSLGQASRTKLEATVLEHEFGHILGLVDIGSPMQTNHKDAAHGNHCSNTNCLMYYASETTDILGLLVTGNIPSVDGNCAADLQANGGK
ncbi:MAG TPA: M12 family metallo-peptidase [Chitinophagaceae bacterium]|nr:M12 family metallo-peptidase [Chitinophagaceae bacterium]